MEIDFAHVEQFLRSHEKKNGDVSKKRDDLLCVVDTGDAATVNSLLKKLKEAGVDVVYHKVVDGKKTPGRKNLLMFVNDKEDKLCWIMMHNIITVSFPSLHLYVGGKEEAVKLCAFRVVSVKREADLDDIVNRFVKCCMMGSDWLLGRYEIVVGQRRDIVIIGRYFPAQIVAWGGKFFFNDGGTRVF